MLRSMGARVGLRRSLCTSFSIPDHNPRIWPKLIGAGLVGGALGGYVGWEACAKWKAINYGATVGGRMGGVQGHKDIEATMSDEHVKATFSTSEVRVLLTALPKTEISLYEFEEALNNLETKASVVKLDKKGKVTVSDPRNAVHSVKAEKYKKVSPEEAMRLFRMFDLNDDGVVQPVEIITVLGLHCSGSNEDKAGLIFDIWDTNGDGKVTKKEMKDHIKRLPVINIFGRAMCSTAFAMMEQDEKGVLTKEAFIKSPIASKLLTKMLINSNYTRFLTKENFGSFAEALNEAYRPELHGIRH